jgi:hypothetical protein
VNRSETSVSPDLQVPDGWFERSRTELSSPMSISILWSTHTSASALFEQESTPDVKSWPASSHRFLCNHWNSTPHSIAPLAHPPPSTAEAHSLQQSCSSHRPRGLMAKALDFGTPNSQSLEIPGSNPGVVVIIRRAQARYLFTIFFFLSLR